MYLHEMHRNPAQGGAQLLLRCVERLLRLKLYELPEAVFGQIRRELCSDDIGALERVISSVYAQ